MSDATKPASVSMLLLKEPHLPQRSRVFTQLANATAILLGSLAPTGWQLQIEGLNSNFPVSMDPIKTAGMFCGVALGLLPPEGAERVFRFLASALAMVGIALGLRFLSDCFFGETWEPEVYGISRKMSSQKRV